MQKGRLPLSASAPDYTGAAPWPPHLSGPIWHGDRPQVTCFIPIPSYQPKASAEQRVSRALCPTMCVYTCAHVHTHACMHTYVHTHAWLHTAPFPPRSTVCSWDFPKYPPYVLHCPPFKTLLHGPFLPGDACLRVQPHCPSEATCPGDPGWACKFISLQRLTGFLALLPPCPPFKSAAESVPTLYQGPTPPIPHREPFLSSDPTKGLEPCEGMGHLD